MPGKRTALNRDSLDDVPGHLSLSAVVKPGCPGIRVAGKILHVFERNALAEEIRDRCDSERVRRQSFRQSGGIRRLIILPMSPAVIERSVSLAVSK